MSKYTRPLGASLLVAVTLLGACRSENKKGPDSTALGADTTLNKDLALAGRDTSTQPQLKDVPANAPSAPSTSTRRSEPRERSRRREEPSASVPRTPAPVTTPNGNVVTTNPGAANNPAASGGGAVGTIPAGATLTTHSNAQVCTNTNQVGDHVTATLDNPVTGSNGATIPAGATVNLTVTRLKRSENSNDPIVMEFAVNSVTFSGHTYPLDASVASASPINRVRDEPASKDAEKVGIGAVAGALAGRILGKSTKATVIGGAAGAAAGAATAAATANYQGCIPSGGSIVVRLNSAATVRA
jgi:hypothetical protein